MSNLVIADAKELQKNEEAAQKVLAERIAPNHPAIPVPGPELVNTALTTSAHVGNHPKEPNLPDDKGHIPSVAEGAERPKESLVKDIVDDEITKAGPILDTDQLAGSPNKEKSDKKIEKEVEKENKK